MRIFQSKRRISLVLLLTLFVGFCAGVQTQRAGIPREVKQLLFEHRDVYRPITMLSQAERRGGTTAPDRRFSAKTNHYEATISDAGLLSVELNGVEVMREAGLFLKYNGVSERLGPCKVRRISDEDQKAIVSCDLQSENVDITKKYIFFKDKQGLDVEIIIHYKSTVNISEERISYKTQLEDVRGLDHRNRFRVLTGQNVYTGTFPAYINFRDKSHHDRGMHLLGNSGIPLITVNVRDRYSMIHFYFDSEAVHPHLYFKAARPIIDYTELFLVNLWREIVEDKALSYNRKREVHSQSTSVGEKGTGATHKFTFWFGKNPLYVRKQLQPFGREAALIWTEHGDRQCTRSIQAVYLGTSDESSPSYGRKGFVGHGLRVSKSVFAYSDRVNIGIDVPEYKRVIDAIYERGVEIGPHTMAPETDGWLLEPGFDIFSKFYKSRFWIDHGSASGEGNDEALAREGWDPSSESYILDKLCRYGYEYAWAYWDQGQYVDRGSLKSFNLLYPEDMEQVPLMVWYLNALDSDRTDKKRIFLFNDYWDHGKRDCYRPEAIDNLIAERGVCVSHSYFCLVPSESFGSYKDQFFGIRGEVYEINETFDRYLQHIRQKVDEGKLWNPTVSEWGDYITSLENVWITYLDDRKVMIINNNPDSIRGFSLAILGVDPSEVSIDGATVIGRKEINSDLLLWFDMPPGQRVLVSHSQPQEKR